MKVKYQLTVEIDLATQGEYDGAAFDSPRAAADEEGDLFTLTHEYQDDFSWEISVVSDVPAEWSE